MYKLLHRVWSTQKSRVCRTGFLYDECCAVQSHRSINAAHDHAVRLGRFFFEQPRWNRRDDDRCGAVAFSLSSQAVLRTNLRLGASVSIKRRVVMRWISPFLHGRESQGVSDRQCIDESDHFSKRATATGQVTTIGRPTSGRTRLGRIIRDAPFRRCPDDTYPVFGQRDDLYPSGGRSGARRSEDGQVSDRTKSATRELFFL